MWSPRCQRVWWDSVSISNTDRSSSTNKLNTAAIIIITQLWMMILVQGVPLNFQFKNEKKLKSSGAIFQEISNLEKLLVGRQGISPQYQNRCLDLVVWYCIIIIIVKLDQIIYKYWNETTGFYESLAFARFGSVWWVLWLGWVSWVW